MQTILEGLRIMSGCLFLSEHLHLTSARPGKKEAREVYLIERGTATSAARPQWERGS